MDRAISEQKATILVVDDEPSIIDLLGTVLEEAGYKVVCASNGKEGLRSFFQLKPDLAILDIIMPGMDGVELCRRIREVSQVPIIFLTAKIDVIDRVMGLKEGADYYLTKPMSIVELLAVVESLLRRTDWNRGDESDANFYHDPALTIHYDRRMVLVRGERVSLTPQEFRLLTHLVEHPRQVFSFQELLRDVWDGQVNSPDVVRRYILQLRQKTEETPKVPKLIVTRRGFGYSYVPPPEPTPTNGRPGQSLATHSRRLNSSVG
ncbi:MAG: response regulator transcription factor [Dehalococcoidia bacterium]